MNISVTVGILILTVFLSLSAPAYAEEAPYPNIHMFIGGVNYPDGTPADGELVTIYYKDGDPLNNTTAVVGNYDPGWWQANLYDISGSVIDGDIIVVEVLGESTTFVVDTKGVQCTSDIPPVTPPVTNNGGGGGDGTYPPEPAPTPATPEPAAAEPTVASAEAPTEAPTKAPTKAPTVESTEIETTELKTEGTPGFGAVLTVFAIAGLLVATYLVMRRRE